MEKEQEINNIWNYLANLEGALAELEDLQNLLIIFEEGYFDKATVSLDNPSDMYTLWRDYKYRQSLLFVIERCLRITNSTVKDNVYQIYDSIKILKTQHVNDSQEITNINKIVA